MTGVIVVNKDKEFTSFDVVAVMRGICKTKKIGHTGTLDPMATGVLPVLLGSATKACDLIPDSDKAYQAEFKIGLKTTTGDIWGEVKEEKETQLSFEDINNILDNFRGEIFQIPPMYSAVSVGGQRLYKLARQGIEVEREKRKIFISELNLLDFDGEKGNLYIKCSKGTYIRTLIEDIAESLGALATMTNLTRTEACGFSEKDALSLDELRVLMKENKLETVLRETETLFEIYPVVNVSEAQEKRFSNGGFLSIARLSDIKTEVKNGDVFRVHGSHVYRSAFLGLGIVEEENLKFLKKFI
ncbi:MAG: tRNA pseudouridine(55) synthase TruB [Clostridia bacterium]